MIQGLVEHGFLHITRGKNGGMQRACNNDKISIGKVIRKMENHFNLMEFFDPEQDGRTVDEACRLKGLLARAAEEFLLNLDNISLADRSKPRLGP